MAPVHLINTYYTDLKAKLIACKGAVLSMGIQYGFPFNTAASHGLLLLL